PEKFWTYYDYLKDQGIMWVIASGRQYHNLLKTMQPREQEFYYIAENGSVVMHGSQEISSIPMNFHTVCQIVKYVREHLNSEVVISGKHTCYMESKNPLFTNEVFKYYTNCTFVDDLTQINDEIIKMAICDRTNAAEISYPAIKQFATNEKVVLSGKIWVDVMSMHANKGQALIALQKSLGISKAQTMGFGDYLNDLELIQESGESYAMANAIDEIKNAAKYLAPSNDANGVIEAISKHLNIYL
ncbi:MAG: HAD-IIB family hydrolase, partial [Lentisphaeria bacterium]